MTSFLIGCKPPRSQKSSMFVDPSKLRHVFGRASIPRIESSFNQFLLQPFKNVDSSCVQDSFESSKKRRSLLLQGPETFLGIMIGGRPISTARMARAEDIISMTTESVNDKPVSSSTPGIPVFQTPSGLKYLDLIPGTGPTPKYGQLLSISYTAYIKLPANKKDPNPKPEKFETQSSYLLKHGNGRTIAGLDEGLHTMRVGGERRLLIPPKLGYVDGGLGPIPEYPWDRRRLNELLNEMVTMRGGTLVFEVRLLSAIDDEADQGYYQDQSLSDVEMEELLRRLNRGRASTQQEV